MAVDVAAVADSVASDFAALYRAVKTYRKTVECIEDAVGAIFAFVGRCCYVEKFFAAEILAWLVIAVIGRCVGSAWLSSDVVSSGLPEHEASVSESSIMAVAQSVRVALHTLLSCDLCVMAIVWKSEHELAVCAAVA